MRLLEAAARTAALGAAVGRGLLRPERPSYAVLFVTGECNARCPYCFNVHLGHLGGPPADAGAPLSAEEYARVAQRLRPLAQVVFSGGEPFLRKDLEVIAAHFYRLAGARLFSLPTNGSLPERALAALEKMASQAPLATFNVIVSLDAVGARHDELRGLPGGYAKALSLARSVLALKRRLGNLNLVINTAVTADNAAGVPELVRAAAAELGAGTFHHNVQQDQRLHGQGPSAGRARDAAAVRAALRETRRGAAARLLGAGYVDFVDRLLLRQLDAGRMLYRCNAGLKTCVILPDGRTFPCEPFAFEPRYARFPRLNLRDFDYDYARLRAHPEYRAALRFIGEGRCAACAWSCAAITSLTYTPRNWRLFVCAE